ncbi:MAG: hypothetical protein GYB66_10290 [Chloroflexi bacterium]|nr:hypothetical protein [Chloroflexota bacterium]
MLRKLILVVGLLLLASTGRLGYAQRAAPVDVFVAYDREIRILQIYFTNGVTGLSTVTTIENFVAEYDVLEYLDLAVNGVIVRQPAEIRPHLVTPGGSAAPISFIPQRTDNLLDIDWAISPDGRTVAWAEIFFNQGVWDASLYVAQLDGTDLRELPRLPQTPSRSFTRVAMIAVTNGGDRVFFDLHHPTAARPPEDRFRDYQTLYVYSGQREAYVALPSETDCLCPAGFGSTGEYFIRLERPILGNGYDIRVWNLDNNSFRLLPAFDTGYTQAGNILANPDGSLVLYTLTTPRVSGEDASDTTGSALVLADFVEGEYRIVAEAEARTLAALAFTNREQEAIVVDTQGGVTFKFNLETQVFTQVADKIWLGMLEG